MFAGLLLAGVIVALATRQPAREWLILFGGAVVTAVVGYDRLHTRLVVSPDGVTVHGLWTSHASWQQIRSYHLRHTAQYWSPNDLGELLLWPFVLVFRYVIVFPIRYLARWLFVSRDERRFLDTELTLVGHDGKKLITINGNERYVNVVEAVERIIDRFHALPPPPFTLLDGKKPVVIDTISELEVARTIKITTSAGTCELASEDVPNLYLVIDAVRARGGRVAMSSDLFMPRRARAELA